jgi:hypothetical protein
LIEDVVEQLVESSDAQGAKSSVILSSAYWSSVDRAEIELVKDGKATKFMAKMARFPSVSYDVEREADVLKRLREMRVERIPEVVLVGSCGARAFFVERFIEGAQLKGSNFPQAKRLSMRLDWMKGFYSQTMRGEIEPQELIRRVEKVREHVSDFTDLTEVLAALDSCKPVVKIPSVCWHGDPDEVNFLYTANGLVAVDFGFSKFDEPPAEPYTMVAPRALIERAKDLNLLSLSDGISPFFLAIYANTMHLGEQLRMQAELEKDILIVDRLGEFFKEEFSRGLGNIQILVQRFNELE